jgi:pyruvate,water dikinase
MRRLGFPVPETYLIPKHVQKSYSIDPIKVREQILHEIDQIDKKGSSWAIRSSGEMEDLESHSYAGQFATVLDVKGPREIFDAIEKVWASSMAVSEGPYITESAAGNEPFGMSVIVQEMVRPIWSGVVFSINPVTGRNEYVIEAVKGSGVQLVQDGVRPFRWTWHQHIWDGDVEPEEDLKEVLESLVLGIQKLHKSYGGAVDVEWTYDGEKLYYLQCRLVTMSKFPTIYSNHISREVLPGMIKPLVWSVNIPLVNSAWIRLLEGLLGKLNIEPEQLSKSFYYRAYFNMGTMGALFRRMGLPNDSLESLMGRKNPSGKSSFKPGLKTMCYLPSMLVFLLSNLSLKRKFQKEFTRITAHTDLIIEKLKVISAADYDSCFEEINRIASEAAYYNILIPLTFQISNRVLQKKLKKRGILFENLDFVMDFPELSTYNPNEYLTELQHQWESLPKDFRDQIKDFETLRSHKDDPRLKDICKEFDKFLQQFGHFSESGNDFSATPWREDPDFVFNLLRQQSNKGPAPMEHRGNLTSESKRIPLRSYRRVGRFRLYREMISSEYTRCYGLFRELFLVTGKSLWEKGWMNDPRDVFFLTLDQHNRLLNDPGEDEARSIMQKIENVKKEMEEFSEMVLPSVIYGDTPPPMPGKNEEVLEGIPTSPGIFKSELVVVKGYEDFQKKVEGNILVIPYSDVGWTPLLVRAGAIVSESGGMLSHASIIARELSIPAISSVDHACSLKDGTKATIDGINGKLFINT